jgi:hypothetical protein
VQFYQWSSSGAADWVSDGQDLTFWGLWTCDILRGWWPPHFDSRMTLLSLL